MEESENDQETVNRKFWEEAEENLTKEHGGELPVFLGTCHSIWDEKKRILKEKYNIDWKTPDEMNPNVQFD